MKYLVTIGRETLEVDVDGARVLVGAEAVDAQLTAIAGTPLYHLLLGGQSWTVAVQPLDGVGRWALGTVGERLEVAAVDERARQAEALTERRGPRASGGTVVAPMPGLVVRLEVAPGQHVEAGAGLVVVEAMKMENELRAARAGVVAAVHVAVGQAVEKGAPLVTFASQPSQPSG
jgi:biotin carboxyl carrier protein